MSLHDQAYEIVTVGSLSPHPDNPRAGDVDAIAESVAENGFYGTIVAQRSTGYVLAGNHRLLAARQQGLAEVPVVWVDVDDDRARRILLVDNRSNDVASYDEEALASLLKDLAVTESGLAGTGYSADDLARLAGRPEVTEGETESDGVPDETPTDPESRPGDVWILGDHKLLVGDATDVAAVESMLDGERCGVLWTDPPYGVSYVGRTTVRQPIENDARDGEALAELLAGVFAVGTTVLEAGAPFYVAHPDASRVVFETAVKDAGWELKQNLVWVKDTFVVGYSDYHWRHEPLLYGYLPGSAGRRGRFQRGSRWHGPDNATTILEYAKPGKSSEHPTMKPVDLIAHCLSNSAAAGGLVLDLFAGSGSTLIAAHRLGLRARLVEIDPQYADVICRRFQEHTGIRPVLASTGEARDFTAAPRI